MKPPAPLELLEKKNQTLPMRKWEGTCWSD